MKSFSFLVLVVGTLVVTSVAANDTNIAGKWEGEATPSTGGSANSWTMMLDQAGSEITGTYVDTFNGEASVKGVLSGTEVEWSMMLGGGVVSGSFEVDGDEWINCSYEAPGGGGKCSAKRAE